VKEIPSMSKFFKKIPLKFNPEITHGVCPKCDEFTALLSLTRDFFKCVTCGYNLEQKVNGKISYIPMELTNKELDVTQKGK